MSELASEKPTIEELRKYLGEYWIDQNKSRRYFLEEFQIDFSKTYKIFYDWIFESLIRLNKFSRENEFWHNTNKKPTIYKLDEFCRIILQENPNDSLALQTLLALSIINGYAEEKFSEIIGKLVNSQDLSVETLIEIYLMEDLFYDDNSGYFAGILFNLELTDKAMPNLLLLSNSKNNFVSNWSKTVLSKITNE